MGKRTEENGGERADTGAGLVGDVERIEQGHVPILRKEELAEVVETPLLPACEVLWDKNIPAFMTSANKLNAEDGAAWILLRYGDLDHRNLGIALELGRMEVLNAGPCVWLEIPMTEGSDVTDVAAAAVAMAERFEEQSPLHRQLVFDADGVREFWKQIVGTSIDHLTDDADLTHYTGFEYDKGTGLFFREKGVRERYLRD